MCRTPGACCVPAGHLNPRQKVHKPNATQTKPRPRPQRRLAFWRGFLLWVWEVALPLMHAATWKAGNTALCLAQFKCWRAFVASGHSSWVIVALGSGPYPRVPRVSYLNKNSSGFASWQKLFNLKSLFTKIMCVKVQKRRNKVTPSHCSDQSALGPMSFRCPWENHLVNMDFIG